LISFGKYEERILFEKNVIFCVYDLVLGDIAPKGSIPEGERRGTIPWSWKPANVTPV